MAMVAGALSPSKLVIDNILIDDPIIVFKCFFNVLKIIILMVSSLLHGMNSQVYRDVVRVADLDGLII